MFADSDVLQQYGADTVMGDGQPENVDSQQQWAAQEPQPVTACLAHCLQLNMHGLTTSWMLLDHLQRDCTALPVQPCFLPACLA